MTVQERSQKAAKQAAVNFAQGKNPGFVCMADTAFVNKGDWVVRVELHQDQHFRRAITVRVPVNAADSNIRIS